ncbi:hypothetical protein ACFY19_39820 [Streptosporangium saharense]|uniref:Uncharacterized protein n=1 Tax=Streptosporangium saharense TaxID=1706840 RepID=A0A7W7QRX7_9ACTN|nr:hypothetical protein [Streptosporangium saharense]MBB4918665.1 hypothetical protein [Streptosporangium saharense]
MSQNIHVTSACIANVQRNLTERVIPEFQQLKTKVDSTDVDFPGFGVLGLPFGSVYNARQEDIKKMVEDAIGALDAWIAALETIKQNWKNAEKANEVTYS